MTGRHVELVVRCRGCPDRRLVLEEGILHIGRAEDNGLVLRDISVSRRHARITVADDGIFVDDLGSGNGCYIQGHPVKHHPVSDGDEIFIDPFILQFIVRDAVKEPVALPPVAAPPAPIMQEPSPSLARLELIAGHGLEPEYAIPAKGLTLGRGEQRDIVIPDPAASRRHSEVVQVGDRWMVRDAGSGNGTFVNTRRIREHMLEDGDRIRIGNTEFRFVTMSHGVDLQMQGEVGGTRPFSNLMFTDPSLQPMAEEIARGGPVAVAPGIVSSTAHAYQPPASAAPTLPPPAPVAGHTPVPLPPVAPVQAPPAAGNSSPSFGTASGFGSASTGPLSEPPLPMSRADSVGAQGFGAVEMTMEAPKPRKGGKMRSSRVVSGKPQGTFMERNIRRLTVGILLFALVMVGYKLVRETTKGIPSSQPAASTASKTPPSSKAPATSVSTSDPEVAAAPGTPSSTVIEQLLEQGNTLFKDKRYLEAVEKYAQVQKLNPGNAVATKMGYHACEFLVIQSVRDELVRRTTSATEAKAAYDKAMEDTKNALAGRFSIATAREELVALKPFFPDDTGLMDMLRRIDSTVRGQVEATEKKKQESYTASVAELYDAAEREAARGDLAPAIQAYQRVLAADPQKQTDYYYKAEEKIQQAKSTLSERGRESYRAGLESMKSGDLISARKSFREAVRQDPFNSAASKRLGEVQAQLNEAALKMWGEAEIYEASNQLEMAIGRYRKVIEYSESPSANLAQKAKKRIDALIQ